LLHMPVGSFHAHAHVCYHEHAHAHANAHAHTCAHLLFIQSCPYSCHYS
jgi:hypothetical protein